ncbi:MAG: PDZ domain-containing protein, partial [Candidatus Eisenbacteria bacterium]|nr:PDZ domain-containing protein [Candidatus Eisenbacteria bacterium]
EESSFDAWIKLYRADENTVNTTVSYYLKGGIVAWLLDLQLREATGGNKSLDDLMRLLYTEYSGAKGFTDAQVQEAAETVAGGSLDSFFAKAVRSREELEFDQALSYLGLRFRESNEQATPWLGIEAQSVDGRLVISSVRRDGPGYEAGLNVQDELLALGGYRVTNENHLERLSQYAPGERIELLISRFDAVRSVPIVLGSHPGNPWQLERDPNASATALANFQSWLYQGP